MSTLRYSPSRIVVVDEFPAAVIAAVRAAGHA